MHPAAGAPEVLGAQTRTDKPGAKLDQDEARLKRLRMRSWRRGMKEMDLILGPFADSEMGNLTPAELDDYEALLNENDQDLYPWVTARMAGRNPGPAPLVPILDRIAVFATERLRPES